MANKYLEPIDTVYKDYRFRSRLEAKWAVFFEKMGWNWVYEHEGFKLPSGPYLPDFYFPDLDIYAEVKPFEFSEEELKKCSELSELKSKDRIQDGVDVILLVGQPELKPYELVMNGAVNQNAIMLPKGSKYYPLFISPSEPYVDFMETKRYANYAKKSRFEFEWREK